MFDFIFAGENSPFVISIALMMILALMEGVGLLLGAGMSDFFDTLLPDLDLDFDVDAPDLDAQGGLVKLLGWLRIGEVPALVLLVVFLSSYGLLGLMVQAIVQQVTGTLLPWFIAGTVVFFADLPVVRTLGGLLGKVLPKDETYAVAEDDFIGRVAEITLGKATRGKPASGKMRDQHGTTHYIMVEPDEEGEEFQQGDSVLLVSRSGSLFKAIRNTKDVLTD